VDVDVTLTRAAALAAVLLVAVAFGLLRRSGDGRARRDTDGRTIRAEDLGVPLGARATLLQFSSEFCAPCRSARRLLSGLAEQVDGVRHVELDAVTHLDLVRRLDIRRTPTVLVLDAAGQVRSRVVGVPARDEVTGVLGMVPVHGSAPG